MAYPATFDVQRPTEFDKAHVVLRIVLIIVVSVFLESVLGALYLLVPVLAAIMISQKGAEKYLSDAQDGPTKWLRYLMGFFSYVALATDKLPLEKPEEVIEFDVQTTGTPTVGSALLRIILAIPHAIVLAILGIVFVIVWVIAAISILLNESYPEWAFSFIRGYLRWTARLYAYLASLVDEYPPFSFENGGVPTPAPGAPPAAQEPPPSEGDAPGSEG